MHEEKNIFIGDNNLTEYVHVAYKLLMSRQWVNALDVASANEHLTPLQFEKKHGQLSNFPARKAVRASLVTLYETLNKECGEGSVIKEGNNRTLRYRYTGVEDDPLRDMINASAVKDLKDYYIFCQESAGFFPSVWLDHFFGRTFDLVEIKRKRRQRLDIIGTSFDRELTNIELLPFVYECIRYKNVIEVEYHEGFQESTTTVVFHPHYLKEFNGRWHVFGHAEGKDPNDGFDIPLDRINGKPTVLHDEEYREPQNVSYPDFFHDIVGTTHIKDEQLHSIIIRIHSEYMFGLVESKPIHRSQETVLSYDKERGYGEVKLQLRPNNEFYGRVLQMGEDLEIVSPDEVRGEVTRRISNMYARYNKDDSDNGSL